MRWRLVALDVRVNGSVPRVHGTLDGAVTACGKERPDPATRWHVVARGKVTCTACGRAMVAFARATLGHVAPRESTEPWVSRRAGGDDAS